MVLLAARLADFSAMHLLPCDRPHESSEPRKVKTGSFASSVASTSFTSSTASFIAPELGEQDPAYVQTSLRRQVQKAALPSRKQDMDLPQKQDVALPRGPPGVLSSKQRGEIQEPKEAGSCYLQMSHERRILDAMQQENARLAHENMVLSMQKMNVPPGGFGQVGPPGAWMPKPFAEPSADGMSTSLMMRNLPNCYTREMLLALLNDEGFAGSYNFIYLPIDFRRGLGLGYAFINFVTPMVAQGFHQHFSGFSQWRAPSDKVCEVTCSDTLHGLEALIDHYRNSPVMHDSIPEEHKPLLFAGLERVQFPPPTKRVRAPRLWHYRRKHE
jgi:hypothetical protein